MRHALRVVGMFGLVLVLFAGGCFSRAGETTAEKPAQPKSAGPGDTSVVEIKNGSMEMVADNTLLPTNYNLHPPGGGVIVLVDPTVAFEGKQSLKVVLRGKRESVYIIQQPPSNLPEGSSCQFQVRVRTHDLAGKAHLFIYRYPSPGEGDGFYSTEQLSGTHDWTIIKAIVPAKKGGTEFQVRMVVEGISGRVWWDKLEAIVEEKK